MLQKAQKKFNGISLMRVAYIAETSEQALRDVEGPVQHMYVEGYSEPGHPLLKNGSMSMLDWVNDRFLVGTPSTIIESVAKLKKEGVDHLILRMALPGLPEEKILRNIKMFGEKILSRKGIF
jgi:alkanesulfonate monooxygenase SsuD/methylene tetrahydromethanopterin reductase-like flavin-dependent oxidoreductase (luciferase family)